MRTSCFAYCTKCQPIMAPARMEYITCPEHIEEHEGDAMSEQPRCIFPAHICAEAQKRWDLAIEDNKRLRLALERISNSKILQGEWATAEVLKEVHQSLIDVAKEALHQAQGEDKGGVK